MANRLQIKRNLTPGVVPSGLSDGELAANLPDQRMWVGQGSNSLDMTAVRRHSDAAAYALDDLAAYNGEIYKCIVAHTAQAFTGSNWSPISQQVTGGVDLKYNWDTSTTNANAQGEFATNNSTPANATMIMLNELTDGGTYVGNLWENVAAGDTIGFTEDTGDNEYQFYQVLGPAVKNANWYEIPAVSIASDGNPDDENVGTVTYYKDPGDRLPIAGEVDEILRKDTSGNYDTKWSPAAVNFYNTLAAYEVGEWAIQGDVLYRAINASTIPAGAFIPGDWEDPLTTRMNWQNLWTTGSYDANDVVRDGDWTMVANKTTTDRAAPQDVGPVLAAIDETLIPTVVDFAGTVEVRQTFTFTKAGHLKAIKLLIPNWTTNTNATLTIINLTTGASEVHPGVVLNDSGDWVLFQGLDTLVIVGTQYELRLSYFTETPGTTIDGGWSSSVGSGAPPVGGVIINNLATPTRVAFNHVDLDSTNRSTELDGVVVGSVIQIVESGDTTRSFTCEVTIVDTTQPDHTIYTVNEVVNGPKDVRGGVVCTCSIEIPISTLASHATFVDLWLAPAPFATVTSELLYSSVPQADVDDAYGINLLFQPAELSPDWEVLAVNSGGGSTAPGGENGIPTGGEIDEILIKQSTLDSDVTWLVQGVARYNTLAAYAIGEWVVDGDTMYQCVNASAMPAGLFVPGDWAANIDGGTFV